MIGSASARAALRCPIPRVPGGDPFANEPVDWPEAKPPFLANAAQVAPDGRLWVLRTRAYNELFPSYDVIDAEGRLVERVTLPPRTRLVGFGRGVLYLARSDNDELQWLGRYRLTNP